MSHLFNLFSITPKLNLFSLPFEIPKILNYFISEKNKIVGDWIEYYAQDESYTLLRIQYKEKKISFWGQNYSKEGKFVRDFGGENYTLVSPQGSRYIYYFTRHQYQNSYNDGNGRHYGIGCLDFMSTNEKIYHRAEGYFCDGHKNSTKHSFTMIRITEKIMEEYGKIASEKDEIFSDNPDFIKWFDENSRNVLPIHQSVFFYQNKKISTIELQ